MEEEESILSEREQAELLASLKKAETQIEAGAYVEYEPRKLKDRMLRAKRR